METAFQPLQSQRLAASNAIGPFGISALFALVGQVGTFIFAQPIAWFQPTAVGMSLGVMFVAGLILGTVGQGKAIAAMAVTILVVIAYESLRSITELGNGECVLFATGVVGTGWLTSKCGLLEQTAISDKGNNGNRRWQWTMWDMSLLTFLCACTFSGWHSLDVFSETRWQVALAFAAGTMASWLAVIVGSTEKWTNRTTLTFVLVAGGLGWLAISFAPSNPHRESAIRWFFTTPLCVAWSQATAVLVMFAAVRFDCRNWYSSKLEG